ncbi:MAG: hypothetical protein DCC73_11525 [Proteobacteria bacterium]|nr:MAG: hypothetical protein DCC73_11525 [Pseudomonadota bacterium]
MTAAPQHSGSGRAAIVANHRRRAKRAAEFKARAYQMWLACPLDTAEADLSWRLYQAAEALYEHHLAQWIDRKKDPAA